MSPREAAKRRHSVPTEALIGLSLDIRLTLDDLARLNPEQITALFGAFATIAQLADREHPREATP